MSFFSPCETTLYRKTTWWSLAFFYVCLSIYLIYLFSGLFFSIASCCFFSTKTVSLFLAFWAVTSTPDEPKDVWWLLCFRSQVNYVVCGSHMVLYWTRWFLKQDCYAVEMLNERCLHTFPLINSVVAIESGAQRLRWTGRDPVSYLHHLSVKHKVGWDWLRGAVHQP